MVCPGVGIWGMSLGWVSRGYILGWASGGMSRGVAIQGWVCPGGGYVLGVGISRGWVFPGGGYVQEVGIQGVGMFREGGYVQGGWGWMVLMGPQIL